MAKDKRLRKNHALTLLAARSIQWLAKRREENRRNDEYLVRQVKEATIKQMKIPTAETKLVEGLIKSHEGLDGKMKELGEKMEAIAPVKNQTDSPNTSGVETPQPAREITLLETQRKTLEKLAHRIEAITTGISIAGFKPRPPLVIGMSGTGKTTIIRALGSMKNMPCMLLDASDWSPRNSRSSVWTLENIGRFIETNSKGIIAIDEADKFGGENSRDWWRNVRAEAMLVIEKRIDGLDWKQAVKDKFVQNDFVVIGMGTWQSIFKNRESWKNQEEPDFDALVASGKIPEELLARFSTPILQPAFKRKDYLEGLEAIHENLREKISPDRANELAIEAEDTQKNARWFEDYVTEIILSQIPVISAPKTVELEYFKFPAEEDDDD